MFRRLRRLLGRREPSPFFTAPKIARYIPVTDEQLGMGEGYIPRESLHELSQRVGLTTEAFRRLVLNGVSPVEAMAIVTDNVTGDHVRVPDRRTGMRCESCDLWWADGVSTCWCCEGPAVPASPPGIKDQSGPGDHVLDDFPPGLLSGIWWHQQLVAQPTTTPRDITRGWLDIS